MEIIEVIGYFPNNYGICWSCMPALNLLDISLTPKDQFESIPEEVKEKYMEVSRIIKEVEKKFPGRFYFRFIDAASPPGLWKSIRYRIKKLPCFIYKGRKIYEGGDPESLIDKLMELL